MVSLVAIRPSEPYRERSFWVSGSIRPAHHLGDSAPAHAQGYGGDVLQRLIGCLPVGHGNDLDDLFAEKEAHEVEYMHPKPNQDGRISD